jgi:hypothetical protein
MALVRERTISTDRHLSAKLVPTFAVRGGSVVNTMNPYGCVLGFLDRALNYRLLENTAFRKLDLFLSSARGRETTTLLGTLERTNPQQSSCLPLLN